MDGLPYEETKAPFVLGENDFRKSFSPFSACLVATENTIFRKLYSCWPEFTPLTRKWIYALIFTSIHFRVTLHAQQHRENERRETQNQQRIQRECTLRSLTPPPRAPIQPPRRPTQPPRRPIQSPDLRSSHRDVQPSHPNVRSSTQTSDPATESSDPKSRLPSARVNQLNPLLRSPSQTLITVSFPSPVHRSDLYILYIYFYIFIYLLIFIYSDNTIYLFIFINIYLYIHIHNP